MKIKGLMITKELSVKARSSLTEVSEQENISQWLDITEEVVNDVGPTEGQASHEKSVGERVEVGCHPGCGDQQETAPGAHGRGVMKWVTDDHVVVNGHGAMRKLSVIPKATKKYIWVRHWAKRIVLV